MKSLRAKKFSLLPIALLLSISGCSSLIDSNREPVGVNQKQNSEPKWVSKDQYDQLMSKYKNLLSEHERLKENRLTSNGPDLLGELQGPQTSTESVDVFGKNGIVQEAQKQKNVPIISDGVTSTDTTKEVKLFKKALGLKQAGKIDEALNVFQVMEKSYTPQIRARARFQIASIYFQKAQYDLALQVSEKMIKYDAFSATVLDAIKIAVGCCDKLGLEEKRLKYNSMLVDVFGVTG